MSFSCVSHQLTLRFGQEKRLKMTHLFKNILSVWRQLLLEHQAQTTITQLSMSLSSSSSIGAWRTLAKNTKWMRDVAVSISYAITMQAVEYLRNGSSGFVHPLFLW